MSKVVRVTVTLERELVEDIDRLEKNRSRFVTEAVARELERRRREALLRSLRAPHAEALVVAEEGFEAWGAVPDEDLLDADAGEPVRWACGEGWVPA